jgi:tyrosine-protein phosphatase SIW14
MLQRQFFHCIIALSVAIGTLEAASVADPEGIHNFHQVNEHVYRGAQPNGEGFAALAKLGIKTVVDLRGERSEATEVQGAGMRYVRMAWSGFKAPSEAQIASVLALLDDNSAWPVFVHCRRGADRTGTAIACYRIAHDHWTNQQALDEAKSFGMSSMEIAMQRFIIGFVPTPVIAAHAPPTAAPVSTLPAAALAPAAAPAP